MSTGLVEQPVAARPLYTVAESARYLGLPRTTLHDWAKGYERRFPDGRAVTKGPIVTSTASPPGSPDVPFLGLAEAMVLASFRKAGLSMQRIRVAVRALQREIGIEHALASRRLYTDGAEILYDFAEEYDEDEIGDLVVLRSSQRVFVDVIERDLTRITHDEAGIADQLVLPITPRPLLRVSPTRGLGEPLFMSSGAPLSSVLARATVDGDEKASLEYGVPLDEIVEARQALAA